MSFVDYICNLDEALAAEDEERYREYLLAGGDPQEYGGFRPEVLEHNRRTRVQEDIDRVITKMTGQMRQNISKGNIADVAKVQRWQKVYEVDGIIYDENGNEIETTNRHVFVPIGG